MHCWIEPRKKKCFSDTSNNSYTDNESAHGLQVLTIDSQPSTAHGTMDPLPTPNVTKNANNTRYKWSISWNKELKIKIVYWQFYCKERQWSPVFIEHTYFLKECPFPLKTYS